MGKHVQFAQIIDTLDQSFSVNFDIVDSFNLEKISILENTKRHVDRFFGLILYVTLFAFRLM